MNNTLKLKNMNKKNPSKKIRTELSQEIYFLKKALPRNILKKFLKQSVFVIQKWVTVKVIFLSQEKTLKQ